MRNLLLIFILFNTAVFSQEINSYVVNKETTIHVGDSLEIGLPINGDRFVFLTQGTEPCAAHISGDTIIITKIEIIHLKGRSPKTWVYFKGYGILPVMINLKPALQTEEIIILKQ